MAQRALVEISHGFYGAYKGEIKGDIVINNKASNSIIFNMPSGYKSNGDYIGSYGLIQTKNKNIGSTGNNNHGSDTKYLLYGGEGV